MTTSPPDPSTEATISELLDYTNATTEINALLGEFKQVEDQARKNRTTRKIDIDIDKLREADIISKADTLVPIRIIDSNIRREHPDFMEYLTSSHRVVVFLDKDNLNVRFPELEEWFSAGLRYDGWFIPFFKANDGAATHGWDAVELVIDTDKPLHVAFEHIGHDNLIFPVKDTDDIQACKRIMRRYRVKLTTLEKMATANKFNAEEVKRVREKLDKSKDDTTYIYKVFTKTNDCVYISWWCKECADWLRVPKKLVLGQFTQQPSEEPIDVLDLSGLPTQEMQQEMKLVPLPIDRYPIFLQHYYATEEQGIIDNKGRVFLDRYIQEGVTHLYSNFLNGCTKASSVYAAVENEKDVEADMIQLDVELEPEGIYNKALKFFSPAYPPEALIRAAQALSVVNAEQAGQITFAANNRVDSRKTSAEVKSSMTEENKLTSVSLLLLSGYFGSILKYVWTIVSNRLVNGLIKAPPNIQQQAQIRFQLLPAGDTDVIKRNVELQMRMQAWEIVAQTPLAPIFLADTLALMFPRQADQYRQVLEQAFQQQQATAPLIQELMRLAADRIPPEMQQQIEALTRGQQPQQNASNGQANPNNNGRALQPSR